MIAEMGDPYPFMAFLFNACMGIACSFFLVELNKDTGKGGGNALIGH